MSETEPLDDRLRAVERALTNADQSVAGLDDVAALNRRLDEMTRTIDTVEDRLDQLDAAVQAVRGYVGQQKAVNDEVERRADAALAAVERIERELDTTHPEPAPRQALDSFEPAESGAEEPDAGLLARLCGR